MEEPARLFAEAWKVMVGRLEAPSIVDEDDVVSCFGNVPLIFFNLSVFTRPAATQDDLRTLLGLAAGRAAASPFPTALVVREDWLPEGAGPVFAEAGLVAAMAMTAMDSGELQPPRRPAPAVEIRRVASDEAATDLATVNAHAYHFPVEPFECICNLRLWHPDSLGFVAYAGGKPVSAAATFPVAGTVYVALVATMPGEQGKGYADTVMRHAVIEGQKAMGTLRTTLHATDMGRPVYQAMGYASGPRLQLYVPAG